MVEAFVRMEAKHYVRTLIAEFQDSGKAEFWGDPVKALVSLLIFRDSAVKCWVQGRGLKVDLGEEACAAIKTLMGIRPTWRKAAKYRLLQNPTPQHVLQTLAIDAFLRPRSHR